MNNSHHAKPRSLNDLAREFVALELELTDSVPAECLRLHRQHEICIELTARTAWTQAGPLIDAEVARVRRSVFAKAGRERE